MSVAIAVQVEHTRASDHVVVIGGGVIGVTTAAALASRGLTVTLIERSDHLGSGATAGNGAQLSYSYVDALAAPQTLRDLPRLLAGLDPAFRIRPDPSARFASWLLRFLWNCSGSRFVSNSEAVLRLALRSRSALAEMRSRHPTLAFNHTATGKVHIYDSAGKFEAAKAAVPMKNALGCDQRIVQPEELFAIEPALLASRRTIVGAIYSPLDEAGDSFLFTQSLAEIAQREFGLQIVRGTSVEALIGERRRIRAVRTSDGQIEGDTFVLTAGADSPQLVESLGLRLPISPMKGYSITLPATERAPTVSITDTRAKIVICRLGDRVRIAGMAELGRCDRAIDSRRVSALRAAAEVSFPAAADWQAEPTAWSGLRPMTPDSRPIIGPTPISNLFLNCGHGMLGWTLACGSAELVTELIASTNPALQIQALANDFRFARF